MACDTSYAVMGWQAQFGTAVSNHGSPPTDPSAAWEFLSSSVGLGVNRQDVTGINGTRSTYAARIVEQSRAVGGTHTLHPHQLDADFWLPYILGGTPTGTNPVTYPLGESLPCFDYFLNVGPDRFNSRECRVSRATFQASSGGPLTLSLDIVGRDRDEGGGGRPAASWPSGLNVNTVYSPFMFYEAKVSIAGSLFQFKDVSLSIDNQLDQSRFMNSLTPTEFPSGGRTVTLSLSHPWGQTAGLLTGFRQATAAVALTFSTGTAPADRYLTFTMPQCLPQQLRDPSVDARQSEVMLPLSLTALANRSGGSKVDELSVQIKVPA